jgi:hypothetical protein
VANYNTFSHQNVKYSAQSVTVTSETQLSNGASGSANVIVMPGQINSGQTFVVRIAGYVTTDTTGTATINLYYSNSASAPALTTKIATTGASQSLATASTNFALECWLQWDSVSNSIRGLQYGWAGTTAVGGSALTNGVTSLTTITSPPLTFTASVAFSAVTTAATVAITDFSIDVD